MLYASLIAVALVAWTVVYFAYIRPKLVEFKLTAGIYSKVEAAEGDTWKKVMLHLQGSKTTISAFVLSMIPVIGPVVEGLNGLKWDAVFPTETASTIAFVFAFIVAVTPMFLAFFHTDGIATAARTVPVAIDPAAPIVPAPGTLEAPATSAG